MVVDCSCTYGNCYRCFSFSIIIPPEASHLNVTKCVFDYNYVFNLGDVG